MQQQTTIDGSKVITTGCNILEWTIKDALMQPVSLQSLRM